MNVWMRRRSAGARAPPARSMSPGAQRARPAMIGPRTSPAIRRTASASASDAMGKPASITSTPSRASCRAMRSFSSMRIEKPGACSPSLSVVSNTITRLASVMRRSRRKAAPALAGEHPLTARGAPGGPSRAARSTRRQ